VTSYVWRRINRGAIAVHRMARLGYGRPWPAMQTGASEWFDRGGRWGPPRRNHAAAYFGVRRGGRVAGGSFYLCQFRLCASGCEIFPPLVVSGVPANRASNYGRRPSGAGLSCPWIGPLCIRRDFSPSHSREPPSAVCCFLRAWSWLLSFRRLSERLPCSCGAHPSGSLCGRLFVLMCGSTKLALVRHLECPITARVHRWRRECSNGFSPTKNLSPQLFPAPVFRYVLLAVAARLH